MKTRNPSVVAYIYIFSYQLNFIIYKYRKIQFLVTGIGSFLRVESSFINKKNN